MENLLELVEQKTAGGEAKSLDVLFRALLGQDFLQVAGDSTRNCQEGELFSSAGLGLCARPKGIAFRECERSQVEVPRAAPNEPRIVENVVLDPGRYRAAQHHDEAGARREVLVPGL